MSRLYWWASGVLSLHAKSIAKAEVVSNMSSVYDAVFPWFIYRVPLFL